MADIQALLGRRSDLSAFVVHLTKNQGDDGAKARENLVSMLVDGKIEARSVYGWCLSKTRFLPSVAVESQKAVCCSEVPLEQIYTSMLR